MGEWRVQYDPAMCPPAETQLRTQHEMVHFLERDPLCATELRLVKSFSRSAAGQKQNDPRNLRSPGVCLNATQYLIQEILYNHVSPFDKVRYHFIFDRLRAIRQDLVVQSVRSPILLAVLEICVRFHLLASHQLCHLDPGDFDHHINFSHCLGCLQDVLVLQEELAIDHPNRAEMTALFILANPGSPDALDWAVRLPASIRKLEIVHRSLRLAGQLEQGNWVGALKLMRTLPILHQLAVFQQWHKIVRHGLDVINQGFGSKTCRFPIATLNGWLNLDPGPPSTLIQILLHLGIPLDESRGYVHFRKQTSISSEKTIRLKPLPMISNNLKSINLKSFILQRSAVM
ncbi:SAC3 domain-containing protein 1-like isoform X2 [Tigriopus californicus]|nr:SAC3 domain-containing protein 1-like isoform X2 [Tigriopus californicus]